MVIEEIGKITENIYLLGDPAMPLYLVDGDRPAIIDSAFSFLAGGYADAVAAVLGNRQPAFCLLTHSHFDHVGGVSGLKERFPQMRVIASPRTATVLAKPKAVALIRALNRAALDMADNIDIEISQQEFEPFVVDRTLKEGERIDISPRMSIRVLETPGHTRDCLSYYIPEKRVLFASEAAGIPDLTGDIICDCLVDYGQYMASLGRLRGLAIDFLCLGHRAVYTGRDAAEYLADAESHCRGFYRTTARSIRETGGDLKGVIARIRQTEYDPKPNPKQPEPAYLLNLEARVRAIQQHLGRSEEEKAGAPEMAAAAIS
jgi:2-aminobenzoylacetyl-CoA thioesterase